MTMSPEMREFLTAWLKWIEDGAPETVDGRFQRRWGLCATLNEGREWELEDELEEMLFEDFSGADRVYPFGGCSEHWKLVQENTQHLNMLRINWVKEKLS